MPWLGMSVGRLSVNILGNLLSYGLSPPCMQSIFYSMMAAMGMALKQSVKTFQSLIVNFLLPELIEEYTSHKNHKVC